MIKIEKQKSKNGKNSLLFRWTQELLPWQSPLHDTTADSLKWSRLLHRSRVGIVRPLHRRSDQQEWTTCALLPTWAHTVRLCLSWLSSEFNILRCCTKANAGAKAETCAISASAANGSGWYVAHVNYVKGDLVWHFEALFGTIPVSRVA